MNDSIQSARQGLKSGVTTSRKLVEEALARARAADGEGEKVFIALDADKIRQTADAADAARATGAAQSAIAGLPISVKDLFDVEGEVTTAGSPQMQSRAPATKDAPAIARLRAAGAVIVGRTNMTEFAYSGLGLNPHFGTPANPYDRKTPRIPGGSSSGGAVSVTDGMAIATVGSDTGGSTRVPAALCGITGFKPTQRRIPLTGVFPLALSLDSVGTMGRTVSCCAILDAVLAGDEPWKEEPADLHSLHLAIPTNYFLDGMDAHVANTFAVALSMLSRAGAKLTERPFPEIADIAAINAKGGIAPAESYAVHSKLGTDLSKYDAIVRERILSGQKVSPAIYREMLDDRRRLIDAFNWAHGMIDAIVCPTVPIIAPEIRVLEESMDELRRLNMLLLRNPSPVNVLDRCALSIPCHKSGEAPVGLMLIGRNMDDKLLFSIGLAVEKALGVQ